MKTDKICFATLLVLLLGVTACHKVQEVDPEAGGYVSPVGAMETKVVQLGDEYASSAFLVKFKAVPTADQLDALLVDGVASVKPYFISCKGKEELEHRFGLDRWYEVALEEGADIDALIHQTASLSTVAVAEYECFMEKTSDCIAYPVPEEYATKAASSSSFNDPMLKDQWHYDNNGLSDYSPSAAKGADVNVKDVWRRLTCGDPDIIVAVIDEAVCYTNPDLAANMWVNQGEIPNNGVDDDGNGYIDDVYGFNFVDMNGNVNWDNADDSGHGTHCAGTIAAVNNNGKGVAGIAGGSGKGDGCRIMSCQIFSGKTNGNTPLAIKYAADNGASVISCSFGFSAKINSDDAFVRMYGSATLDAIHYFEASKNNPVLDGNIAIFASGNESHGYAHYPGAFYDIISVSAFGPDFLPTYYTNYGPGCNICAPGGEAYVQSGSNWNKSMVLSTLPNSIAKSDYGYMQGTSMACPHVSGVVALGLSYAKQLGKTFTVQEFKEMILSSTDDIDQRIGSTSKKTYAYGKASDRHGHGELEMGPYYHQMGTGAIDAWRLMMHIEGTPCLTAQTGRSQWIDLTQIFGTSSTSLTYLQVEVPAETITAMGLQAISPVNDAARPGITDASSVAVVQYGRLYIYPTKLGSGKITIHAVGGGDALGGGNNPPGGMELVREVSLIARDANGGNGNGGWL